VKLKIKFIIGKAEETNISYGAKKWFYNQILNGKPGPFVCRDIDSNTKAIILRPEAKQLDLFN